MTESSLVLMLTKFIAQLVRYQGLLYRRGSQDSGSETDFRGMCLCKGILYPAFGPYAPRKSNIEIFTRQQTVFGDATQEHRKILSSIWPYSIKAFDHGRLIPDRGFYCFNISSI